MPAMNLATQKRLGILPKTPNYDNTPGDGYYGGGFRSSKATPILPGFYGLGSAHGDNKIHYFGNEEGQVGLPANGMYGTGFGAHLTDMDYQAATLTIPQGQTSHPNSPGLFDATVSESLVTTQTALGILAVLGIIFLVK